VGKKLKEGKLRSQTQMQRHSNLPSSQNTIFLGRELVFFVGEKGKLDQKPSPPK